MLNSIASSSKTCKYESKYLNQSDESPWKTYWFQAFYKFLWSFMVFQVLKDKHNQIIFFHLTEVFNHKALNKRF